MLIVAAVIYGGVSTPAVLAADGVQDATPPTSQSSNDVTEPARDDRAGLYFLAAIPVIVGVGDAVGVDHRIRRDDSGIWRRQNQQKLEYAVIATELGGALWEGGDSRLGRTYWQSIDATVFSAATAQVLKYATGRPRPSQSSNPDEWRQGGSYRSFPSGEVTLQASFVTPFILEYQDDHPWLWGLEALPLYDAAARVKTRGHWQTDVLAAWALGTAFGIFAHDRNMPFFLGMMPHGVMVGLHVTF